MACLGGFCLSGMAAEVQPHQSYVRVDGLRARTEILIDRWGVPHIFATNSQDAFFAQGWNAARDRLWQIDLWRRSGLGALAAVLGGKYAAKDRATRLFVYRGDMAREWAAYGAQAKNNTKAFVAGINAYVSSIRRDETLMPEEFKLAGYAPALWQADDVVRVRNHGLGGGAEIEAVRAQIVCKAGLAAASLLIKISPPWTPVIPLGLDLCSIPANALEKYELAQAPVIFSRDTKVAASWNASQQADFFDAVFSARSRGSNNWVVAASKTATGRPMLANDPHRAYEIPSLRYLVQLAAPGLNVIGAGEPSLPGVSIGHNDHLAFGFTIFESAQEDLYVYETNPQDPNEYRYNGTWEPMRVVKESISVRNEPDQEALLKFTRHGPVVMEDLAQHRAYAVRATWLDTGGAPYMGSMRYIRAHSVGEFGAAMKFWGGPAENQVCADTSGTIGWFAAGFTPIRPTTDGLLPLPGDGRYEWNGYLEWDLLPSEIDPPRGYIATANQMDLPQGYPYAERRIGFTWADNFRFDRISAVLNSPPKLTIQASKDLQNDYLNDAGRRLIATLNSISVKDSAVEEIIHWLAIWDDRVTAESPQAALFEIWFSRHLAPAVIDRVVPAVPQALRAAIAPGEMALVLDLMAHPDQRLGPDPQQSRDELMLRTLAEADAETRQLLGSDRSAWQWGHLATVRFEHPLAALADEGLRVRMNVGPAPKAGDGNVVGAAAYSSHDFRVHVGASLRMVIDVGHWDDSAAVNAPGQAGGPASPHYRDMFPLWLNGQYFPLLYSRKAVEDSTEQKIVLQPGRGHAVSLNRSASKPTNLLDALGEHT
jgi:penicillin G amidase